MGAQDGSKDSIKFKDAYFTQKSDVEWCMAKLDELYGLDGKTALEPSVGGGAFVLASHSVRNQTSDREKINKSGN